jgi:hypothetical protein
LDVGEGRGWSATTCQIMGSLIGGCVVTLGRRRGERLQRHNLPNNGFADWWLVPRKQIHKDSRKDFDSAVVLVCWLLWLEINDRVFNNSSDFCHVADFFV